jgi:hypothetical protein
MDTFFKLFTKLIVSERKIILWSVKKINKKQMTSHWCIELEDLHKIACLQKQDMFQHPHNGLSILTSFYLIKKNKCCGKKCLFCPYKHTNVKQHTCSRTTCFYQTDE